MVYCFLADGFEETEAIVTIDILRRAGIEVFVAGVSKTEVTSTHNITVKTDISDKDVKLCDELEAVILPGGMPGTTNLDNSQIVRDAVAYCNENGKVIGAICAAPSVFGHMGLLKGKKATCFPGFEDELFGAKVMDLPVVCDGNIVTSKGAGCVFEFSFALVEKLKGKEAAQNVRATMQTPY